ncbi:MAG: hypothetical protein M1514_04180, partial [Patescibacteria group bacterium]|nr:hypothetical protein [Patescibacteria group bacterium]
ILISLSRGTATCSKTYFSDLSSRLRLRYQTKANWPEKEILNQLLNDDKKYDVFVETPPKVENPPESLVQKLEEEIALTKPITDDGGQPLLSSSAPVAPKITLPINKNTYALGLKKKVNESVRWLAEWCLRIIKIFGDKAVFRENQ